MLYPSNLPVTTKVTPFRGIDGELRFETTLRVDKVDYDLTITAAHPDYGRLVEEYEDKRNAT